MRHVRRAARGHSAPRGHHRPDGRAGHGQDHAVPRRARGARSQNLLRVRARPVCVARRPAEDAAHRVRCDVGRRCEERPAACGDAAGAQLSAVRLSAIARSAAGVCGADHRRGAEPFVEAARGDSHPLRSRGTGKASAARARRPARASRQAEGPRDEAGRSAHFRTLLAAAARAGCRCPRTSRTA